VPKQATKKARKEAAEVLRRTLEALPLPGSVASYLRGYADGLDLGANEKPADWGSADPPDPREPR
jgi:hypothetical protein